ncbi:MAG: hypothetical protein WC747_01500 [Candidatus Babeliales bacterium]|jgi:hypothetical protein
MKKLIMMSALFALNTISISMNAGQESYQTTNTAKEAAALNLIIDVAKINADLGPEKGLVLRDKAVESFVKRGGDINQTISGLAVLKTLIYGYDVDADEEMDEDELAMFPERMSLAAVASFFDAQLLLTLIRHGAHINSIENPVLMIAAKGFALSVDDAKTNIEYEKNNIDHEDIDIDCIENINEENSWLSDHNVKHRIPGLCVAFNHSSQEIQQKFLDTYPEFAFLVKAEQK